MAGRVANFYWKRPIVVTNVMYRQQSTVVPSDQIDWLGTAPSMYIPVELSDGGEVAQ
ncbi:hypothetical protein [Nocardia abscessus]|uniref:hypothetical protein n=1 Tax=Nocardia abscessus TaxID=120957 RepID=UPI0024590936|nr:hypothetical protein [Nocardia abscessus]